MTEITGQPVTRVHPRSPAAALAFSFAIPGTGSMYGGNPTIRFLILIFYIAAWAMLLGGFVSLAVVAAILGIWIWGLIHGLRSAQAWNRSHGIVS